MPNSNITMRCGLSAAVSYGVFMGMDWLTGVGIPNTVALMIPGLAFYLALDGIFGRAVSPGWRIVMAGIVTGGWYAAFQLTLAIQSPLYIAGSASGAVGGGAVCLALLPFLDRRRWRKAALFVVYGAGLGALCLPAGFLFGATDTLTYTFLTFFPWQIGMGLIGEKFMRDKTAAAT